MDKLGRKKRLPLVYRIVVENLKHRFARTVLTALAISMGVTMILTIVGLSEGMLDDQRNRARSAGADIMVLPAGMSAISLSSAPLPEKLLDFVREQPHVEIATGAVMQPIGGVRRVTGIDYETFDRMCGGFEYIDGGPMTKEGQTVVDEFYARQRDLRVGDTTEMLDREWEVSGIVEPGKMARLILPIDVVQELTGTVGQADGDLHQAGRPQADFRRDRAAPIQDGREVPGDLDRGVRLAVLRPTRCPSCASSST